MPFRVDPSTVGTGVLLIHVFPRQLGQFFHVNRVEHQKIKQTTLQGFLRQVEHFLTDMSNRVEHQKLNQTTAELSFG